MKRKVKYIGCSALAMTFAGRAMAAPQDWTAVSGAITGEIGAVMPLVLAIFGALIGISVGFRLFGRGATGR